MEEYNLLGSCGKCWHLGAVKMSSWLATMVPNTWIIDLRHYLDADGTLAELPRPALHAALFFGAIVAWVTRHPGGRYERTNVPCRRSPRRRRCIPEIVARLGPDGEAVAWRCPACGDNGIIRGWDGTRWDRRRG